MAHDGISASLTPANPTGRGAGFRITNSSSEERRPAWQTAEEERSRLAEKLAQESQQENDLQAQSTSSALPASQPSPSPQPQPQLRQQQLTQAYPSAGEEKARLFWEAKEMANRSQSEAQAEEEVQISMNNNSNQITNGSVQVITGTGYTQQQQQQQLAFNPYAMSNMANGQSAMHNANHTLEHAPYPMSNNILGHAPYPNSMYPTAGFVYTSYGHTSTGSTSSPMLAPSPAPSATSGPSPTGDKAELAANYKAREETERFLSDEKAQLAAYYKAKEETERFLSGLAPSSGSSPASLTPNQGGTNLHSSPSVRNENNFYPTTAIPFNLTSSKIICAQSDVGSANGNANPNGIPCALLPQANSLRRMQICSTNRQSHSMPHPLHLSSFNETMSSDQVWETRPSHDVGLINNAHPSRQDSSTNQWETYTSEGLKFSVLMRKVCIPGDVIRCRINLSPQLTVSNYEKMEITFTGVSTVNALICSETSEAHTFFQLIKSVIPMDTEVRMEGMPYREWSFQFAVPHRTNCSCSGSKVPPTYRDSGVNVQYAISLRGWRKEWFATDDEIVVPVVVQEGNRIVAMIPQSVENVGTREIWKFVRSSDQGSLTFADGQTTPITHAEIAYRVLAQGSPSSRLFMIYCLSLQHCGHSSFSSPTLNSVLGTLQIALSRRTFSRNTSNDRDLGPLLLSTRQVAKEVKKGRLGIVERGITTIWKMEGWIETTADEVMTWSSCNAELQFVLTAYLSHPALSSDISVEIPVNASTPLEAELAPHFQPEGRSYASLGASEMRPASSISDFQTFSTIFPSTTLGTKGRQRRLVQPPVMAGLIASKDDSHPLTIRGTSSFPSEQHLLHQRFELSRDLPDLVTGDGDQGLFAPDVSSFEPSQSVSVPGSLNDSPEHFPSLSRNSTGCDKGVANTSTHGFDPLGLLRQNHRTATTVTMLPNRECAAVPSPPQLLEYASQPPRVEEICRDNAGCRWKTNPALTTSSNPAAAKPYLTDDVLSTMGEPVVVPAVGRSFSHSYSAKTGTAARLLRLIKVSPKGKTLYIYALENDLVCFWDHLRMRVVSRAPTSPSEQFRNMKTNSMQNKWTELRFDKETYVEVRLGKDVVMPWTGNGQEWFKGQLLHFGNCQNPSFKFCSEQFATDDPTNPPVLDGEPFVRPIKAK
ncbi:hypothetical protein BT69DRAFT_506452 [Atractiella rhizophila]|nr:hypothetical protein BT69DRAFT_506452 [Atractiella rhizophila]